MLLFIILYSAVHEVVPQSSDLICIQTDMDCLRVAFLIRGVTTAVVKPSGT